jgi:hypothetical protein
MQGPDLLGRRQAPGTALLGLHHRFRGVEWGRHGSGECPMGLRSRRMGSCVVERVELLEMGLAHLIEPLREILSQVKGVHYVILIEGYPAVAEGPSFCKPQIPYQRFYCIWHNARPAYGWPSRYTTRRLNA